MAATLTQQERAAVDNYMRRAWSYSFRSDETDDIEVANALAETAHQFSVKAAEIIRAARVRTAGVRR